MSREFWISPSTFAFLWSECRRCWWLKAVGGVGRPFTMPSVFRKMDVLSKDALGGLRLDAIGIPGVVVSTGRKLKSVLIDFDGVLIRIAGEDDIEVQLEDGSIGVYDLKLTTPNEDTAAKYEFQNNAYRFAIENPELKKDRKEVSRLGLLCLTPAILTRPDIATVYGASGELLHGPPEGIPEDLQTPQCALMLNAAVIEQRLYPEGEIRETLRQMAAIVGDPRPPDSAPDCPHCEFTRRQIQLARRLKEDGAHGDILAQRLAEAQGNTEVIAHAKP